MCTPMVKAIPAFARHKARLVILQFPELHSS